MLLASQLLEAAGGGVLKPPAFATISGFGRPGRLPTADYAANGGKTIVMPQTQSEAIQTYDANGNMVGQYVPTSPVLWVGCYYDTVDKCVYAILRDSSLQKISLMTLNATTSGGTSSPWVDANTNGWIAGYPLYTHIERAAPGAGNFIVTVMSNAQAYRHVITPAGVIVSSDQVPTLAGGQTIYGGNNTPVSYITADGTATFGLSTATTSAGIEFIVRGQRKGSAIVRGGNTPGVRFPPGVILPWVAAGTNLTFKFWRWGAHVAMTVNSSAHTDGFTPVLFDGVDFDRWVHDVLDLCGLER